MRTLGVAVLAFCAVLAASLSSTADPLVVGATAVRALVVAYDDLGRELERGAGHSASEFEAAIYEGDGRFEIIFYRRPSDGIERRGGSWFYVIDGSSFRITEKRREK